MKKVFVSGAFNVLHAGHIRFFEDARALGDYLIVSFPPADLLWKLYDKKSVLEDSDKLALISALSCVDEVVLSTDNDEVLSFASAVEKTHPDILAVTTDDKYVDAKRAFCLHHGMDFVVLEKTAPEGRPTSSSEVVDRIKAPKHVPLRVDFAGGWLDVPEYALPGAYVVNCAVSPTVSLREWLYRKGAGMGGSGGWSVLNGWDPVASELGLGVGWQDPAVIAETGACVWKSGPKPVLDFKNTGEFLRRLMAVYDTRIKHNTPGLCGAIQRPFAKIAKAARVARLGIQEQDINVLAIAVNMSYKLQRAEGQAQLPEIGDCLAHKYCGGGHGGYALYLYETPEAREAALDACEDLYPIEPYCRTFGKDEPVPWQPKYLERLRRSGALD